jgi:hypothetical protein
VPSLVAQIESAFLAQAAARAQESRKAQCARLKNERDAQVLAALPGPHQRPALRREIDAGLSDGLVIESLRRLADAGEIEVIRTTDNRNTYRRIQNG